MIYVLQPEPGGPVKIGFVRGDVGAVHRRLAALELGSPWPLKLIATIRGGRYEESQLHLRFAALNIHREWFRLEGELMLWLNGIARVEVGPSMPATEAKVIPLRPDRAATSVSPAQEAPL